MWSMKWRHFQLPLMTPNLDFKVTPLFDSECFRNGTRMRYIDAMQYLQRLAHTLVKGVILNDPE